jgi:hypothetical protein
MLKNFFYQIRIIWTSLACHPGLALGLSEFLVLTQKNAVQQYKDGKSNHLND